MNEPKKAPFSVALENPFQSSSARFRYLWDGLSSRVAGTVLRWMNEPRQAPFSVALQNVSCHRCGSGTYGVTTAPRWTNEPKQTPFSVTLNNPFQLSSTRFQLPVPQRSDIHSFEKVGVLPCPKLKTPIQYTCTDPPMILPSAT